MGLRCIIGHDYGDLERSETREERGDEQVVTVREYRECTRCGHQQVISENTEVRSTHEPTPPEEENTEDSTGEPESGAGAEPPEREYEDVSAAEDDGVILEDDEPKRERGEWPESEGAPQAPDEHGDWPDDHREETAGTEGADHGDWPTTDEEDEGFDAEPSSGGPEGSVDFGGGLDPERPDEPIEGGAETVEGAGEARDGPEASGAGGTDAGSGIRRSNPGPSPTTQQRPADPDTVFVCPNCSHTAPAHASSLRPGDICPECGRGYLTEREDA